MTVLNRWRDAKYDKSGDTWTNRRYPGIANFSEEFESFGDDTFYSFRANEHMGATGISLDAQLLWKPDAAYLQVDVSASSGAGGVRPSQIEIATPAFVRELVTGHNWCSVYGDKIKYSVINIEEEAVNDLITFLESPIRALPCIVISGSDGHEFCADLSTICQQRTLGLAHVVALDDAAAWRLTDLKGRDWSCFWRGCRIYWPGLTWAGNPRAHHLWTSDLLARRTGAAQSNPWVVSALITNPIFEASTFNARIADLENATKALREIQISRAIAAASKKSDYNAIFDRLTKQIDELREEVDFLRAENKNLMANVVALSSTPLSSDQEQKSEDAVDIREIKSISEAVKRAKESLEPRVAFPDKLDRQLETIAPAAYIEKTYEALMKLGELERALSSGEPLGDTTVKWLETKGLNASGESETTNNLGLLEESVLGEQMKFELHAKISDGVPANRCIRIYFRVDAEAPRVKIGAICSKKYLE